MSAADDSAQEVEALTAAQAPSTTEAPSSSAPQTVSTSDNGANENDTGSRGSPPPQPTTASSSSAPHVSVSASSSPSPNDQGISAGPMAQASSRDPHDGQKSDVASKGAKEEHNRPQSPNGGTDSRRRTSNLMGTSAEASSFIHWLQALPRSAGASESLQSTPSSPSSAESSPEQESRAARLDFCSSVSSLDDLMDGRVLASLLSFIDPGFFPDPYSTSLNPSQAIGANQSMDEYLRRQAVFKRIHKQALTYLDTEEHLDPNLDASGNPPESLNLDADLLAHSSTSLTKAAIESELLKLARLVLLVAVRSKHQGLFISVIQSRLDPGDQQGLMNAISSVQTLFTQRGGDASFGHDAEMTTEPEETDTDTGTDTTTTDADDGDEEVGEDEHENDDEANHTLAGVGELKDKQDTNFHSATERGARLASKHDSGSLGTSSDGPDLTLVGENGARSPLKSPFQLNHSSLQRLGSDKPNPLSDEAHDESGNLIGLQPGLGNGGLTPLQRVASNSTTGPGSRTAPGTTVGSDEEPELDSDDIMHPTSTGFGLFGAGSESLETRGAAVAERLLRKGGTPALVKAFSRLRSLYETRSAHTESLEASLPVLQERVEAQEAELTTLREGVGAHASETEMLKSQRQDLDRLTDELRRTEDALASAEASVDNLRPKASAWEKLPAQLAERDAKIASLVDQLDEARHASEALVRAQGQIEKYQRKLSELQDVKRQLRSSEAENKELMQRNETMADEAERVGPVRGLVDRYKAQVKQLQLELTQTTSRLQDLQNQHEVLQTRLTTATERVKADQEELELYQERVHELELGAGGRHHARRSSALGTDGGADDPGDESFASEPTVEEHGAGGGLGEELEDAMAPKSRTELRLEVRRLTRERDAAVANKADASRILVLENLLEDANGLRDKYEKDYLSEHQERLLLQRQLEDIASGKAGKGDSPEANLALRTRLNQVVEELDETKKSLVNLQVEFDSQTKELTVAKSDLSLVNYDQLDILHKLRASVEKEKEALVSQVDRLKADLTESEEHVSQLKDRVTKLMDTQLGMHEATVEHHTAQVETQRQIGEMKLSLAAKGWPQEATEALAKAEQTKISLQQQLQSITDKREKARQFIRKQDKLIQNLRSASSQNSADPAELAQLKAHVKRLEQTATSSRRMLTEELYTGAHPATTGRPPFTIGPSAFWLSSQRRLAQAGIPNGTIAALVPEASPAPPRE